MRILCCGVERESKEQGVKDITLFTKISLKKCIFFNFFLLYTSKLI